jgi:methanogenic corrinoid protein MtbC1
MDTTENDELVLITPISPAAIDALLHRLLSGDQHALQAETMRLRAAGWRVSEIALELIDPLLVEVGQRWASEQLTVGHEHVVTALCQQAIGQLRASLTLPNRNTAPIAAVGCGPGERHSLGAEIVAGTLQEAGWQIRFLGADMPAAGFVAVVEEWMARLVALSVSTMTVVPATAELVSLIKDGHSERRVVVGGQAAELRDFPEADLVVGRDLMELERAAMTWLHETGQTPPL